jgi:hypothetical protein
MSRGHWQVVKHGQDGRFTEGPWRTWPIKDVPREVVDVALRAAGLIGDGFYGVDLKQTPNGVFVIEVNDNPSIDQGCEDAVLKDDLYRVVIQEFIRRLEERPAVTLDMAVRPAIIEPSSEMVPGPDTDRPENDENGELAAKRPTVVRHSLASK